MLTLVIVTRLRIQQLDFSTYWTLVAGPGNTSSMEYLTIQEPRSSHFRGMDHHQSDSYSRRDDLSRPSRSLGLDGAGSPSDHYHSSPMMTSTTKPRWAPTSSGVYYPVQSAEAPPSLGPISSRQGPSTSIASLLRPAEVEAPKPTDSWSRGQTTSIRPHDSPSKDANALKLPSFNSVGPPALSSQHR